MINSSSRDEDHTACVAEPHSSEQTKRAMSETGYADLRSFTLLVKFNILQRYLLDAVNDDDVLALKLVAFIRFDFNL